MLSSLSVFVLQLSRREQTRLKALLVMYTNISSMRNFTFKPDRKKLFSLFPHPLFFSFYCTWMLLTELCLFTAIGFSTVHAQVSVNINYFYQGLQWAEWLAKRVYCKRQMKMRVQGHMDVEYLKIT